MQARAGGLSQSSTRAATASRRFTKRSNLEVDMKKATHLTGTSVALNRRRFSLGLPLLAASAAASQEVVAAKAPSRDKAPIVTHYRTKMIDGIKIFYREAGPTHPPHPPPPP